MEYTLLDVTNAIASRHPSSFNRLRCFVVNYIAETNFPHKFYYNGCSSHRSNGTYCGKATCDHPRWLTKKMYRFQLQVTDCSSSPPVTVTVFDSVNTLIRMSAKELSTRPPEAQLAVVREKTSRAEMCDLYLKVKEDTYSREFVAVVQSMYIVDIQMDEVLNKKLRTPRSTSIARSPVEIHTPRDEEHGTGSTSIGSSISAGSSSSRRRGVGSRSVADSSSERRGPGNRSLKLSNVKTKMQDLSIAVIDLTQGDE